ncbi:AI-2E family transporter [Streptomyces sp. NBC_00193]|uniref:AI-2E family transporter n=1 Tax=unclassified Streptomyces TaxID=2593676 RepID=UPI00225598A2|nr:MULTISPECIES: AI-2E family transporter [unclassified Streptomyces]MCX5128380.1 AI-2E family transporter [Streptomyces sp. NBC_00347]MCX5300740.1 AI-2E family transporter [Streptomyces sp. NBC_00193]
MTRRLVTRPARRLPPGGRPRGADRAGRDRTPAGAASPTAARAETPVAPGLRTAAGYAWRLLVVGAAAYAVFAVLGRFHELALALFLGLVAAAMLRPPAGLLARVMPRGLAVACALIGSLILVLGALALVGEAVEGEWPALVREFRDGLGRIQSWLQGPPFRLDAHALSDAQSKIGDYLSSHRSTLLSTALSGAGRVVAVFTVAALGLFCSVFFTYSGDRQWNWFCAQLPGGARERVAAAGRAAWRTFTGYTHGIVLVAATNAVLVGIALYLLGVPLAVPLALLEFVAAFVPLIGSPVALGVAAVVALATQGPLVAALVVALIVVIGQIEGHLLHPLVMSWAVRLHPMVVALSVVAGAIAAGIVGAVVAVPLVSVAWSVHQALREARTAA